MKTSITRMLVVAGIALLLGCIPSLYAFADARDNAREVFRPTPPSIQLPSPTPVHVPTPPLPSGGITSVTEGTVDSGGNTGGTVTTGDENVSVREVNIGPTNQPPVSIGETPQPPPQVPCSNDRRGAPNACPIESPRVR